jgi:ureidoglycolate lyase
MPPTNNPIKRLIPLEPLSFDTFVPFGSVIQNPTSPSNSTASTLQHIVPVTANQGSARKFPDISPLDNFYASASSKKHVRGAISLFECKPRELRQANGKDVFEVRILERHPYTTQTFSPLGLSAAAVEDTHYLVIVAPTLPQTTTTSTTTRPPKGTGPPDLQNIRAFLARGNQAVTYAAGTWHAPMVVLGARAIDFIVVQFVNGVTLDDCQEMGFDEGVVVDLSLGDHLVSPKL